MNIYHGVLLYKCDNLFDFEDKLSLAGVIMSNSWSSVVFDQRLSGSFYFGA